VIVDEGLAREAIRQWLGAGTTLTRLTAMNSSAWMVGAGADRYVLKISAASEEAALQIAIWLEDRGTRTGAPIHMAIREDRLIALLRFAEGRPLERSAADVEALGATLGSVHTLLVGAPVPPGIQRWPWSWPDPNAILDPELRQAAVHAIRSAESLAPTVTHGLLHGDPAPEAFLAGDDGIALIDWGAACYGPLLYDIASAWLYAGEGVLAPYARTSPLKPPELAAAPVYLAFRWAVQAWYFSDRIRRGDRTGQVGDNDNDNDKGLADAREGLLGSGRIHDG
jgi:homoserine kinase type II